MFESLYDLVLELFDLHQESWANLGLCLEKFRVFDLDQELDEI